MRKREKMKKISISMQKRAETEREGHYKISLQLKYPKNLLRQDVEILLNLNLKRKVSISEGRSKGSATALLKNAFESYRTALDHRLNREVQNKDIKELKE